MRKRVWAMVLAVAMVLSLMVVPVSATEEVASGTCGDNLTWALDEDGTLTISGTGDMWNYMYCNAWWDYKSSIVTVVLDNGVTSIGSCAFCYCTSVTSITIPDSVTSIGYSAFFGCTSLASVIIPDSVISIGDRAFEGCISLISITVSDGNANFMSENGVLFDKGQTTLICYPSKKSGSYTIPNSVTSIGEIAFYYCASLTSITIPDSVTSIGGSAFYYCSNLVSIIFKGDAPIFQIDNYSGDEWIEPSQCTFLGVSATAYYPANNDSWTADVMQDYGGTITWVAYDPDTLCLTGHTEGEAVIENEVAATCTESGSYDEVVYCSVCGAELSRETVTIPATGHTEGEAVIENEVAATETEDGSYDIVVYCTVCGAELSREMVIVPATGSTDPEPTEPTEPTPTEPTDPEPTEENPFTDVDETNYFYNAVLWAIENGITSGTTETTFSPFAKCERCQVVTFLYRYFDEPEVTTSENPFTDVDTDDYFYSAVLWAVEKGITTGTSDTTFGPFVTCERCMVVTFLYRALVE